MITDTTKEFLHLKQIAGDLKNALETKVSGHRFLTRPQISEPGPYLNLKNTNRTSFEMYTFLTIPTFSRGPE